ncbi:Integrator complex subunit 6 [Podila epigama]|nr:Integrator complex subunit 6 [Podila epigama]
MIVIFLVDTSASMNQKFSNGMSALECTKSGIEHMVKHLPQVKPAEKHGDKFLLVTYEEGPGCIKSSFKDPLPHLIKELKVLKAQDLSSPGASLSTVFDLLNSYRVYHGIDTPGSGRFPGSIEPCVILWFTDGGKQSSTTGVFERLNIPGITSPGADYYHEPFRWDQRLYTIFLEPNADVVDPQLSILSNVMGGASYRVRTVRHMLQAMDCMLGISKIPPTPHSPQAVLHIYAIVVNFEDLIVDPRRSNTVNHHQLVYIPPGWLNPQSRHAGFFPIPEPYWPDPEATRLPTRNAQPTIYFHAKEEKNIDIPEGFPYDKYGVAPCPMTQELLTRPPGTCWPVYVKNSYKTEGFGFPFGFLKANTHKNAVTLTVVAYNYPALFTLLVHLNSLPGRTPNNDWLRDFSEYLSHTPSYYHTPLRNALRRMNINNAMPTDQGALNQVIQRQLNKNKTLAKAELERLQATEKVDTIDRLQLRKKALPGNPFDALRSNSINILDDLKRPFFKVLQTSTTAQTNMNPTLNGSLLTFPPPRFDGTAMDTAMDSDDLHSLPIADMGIYQDRMLKLQQESLRDPFRDEESVKSLQRTMFGNPYKQEKKPPIDEEEEQASSGSVSSNGSTSGSSWSSILGRRRKPRRRSVSPAHFPVERIPSLSHGDRALSSKTQVVSLGPAGAPGSLPMLRIMVRETFGKTGATDEETESLVRPIGMHDGEDEDEEDDDFRRAMFNSDEMEMDVDDEAAARLRADTPMPGGIGMDDDDDDMEELQRAQDNIPPPIVPVSLEDIEADVGRVGFPGKPDSVSSLDHMMDDEDYDKHRQGIKQDLEHLNGSTSPVFEALVYDANSLMELQSIPKTLPERGKASGTTQLNGSQMEPLQSAPLLTSDSNHNDLLTNQSSSLGLVPIPILLPPTDSQSLSSITSSESQIKNQLKNSKPQAGVTRESDKSSIAASSADTISGHIGLAASTQHNRKESGLSTSISTAPIPQSASQSSIQQSPITESPLQFRNAFVKQLRMPPRSYKEDVLVEMLWRIEGAVSWNMTEKRQVVMNCRQVALSMRRQAIASLLEVVEAKLSK